MVGRQREAGSYPRDDADVEQLTDLPEQSTREIQPSTPIDGQRRVLRAVMQRLGAHDP